MEEGAQGTAGSLEEALSGGGEAGGAGEADTRQIMTRVTLDGV